jgi:sec-independent protein translocase protein TatC
VKMSFWEHLDELRSRLLKAAIAYIVGTSVVWAYKDPILAWLWKPFADSWRAENLPDNPALNFAAPGDAFMAYFKLSMIGGILVAAPVIFYQLWAFIAPGLYAKEKKIVLPFVFFSSVLFVGGGLFGWRVAFPVAFQYFLGLANTAQTSGLTIRPVVMMADYLSFSSSLLLAFGLVFELPVFILFLAIAGIVNYLQLIRFGRWFILVAFTVGAIITPPDMTSQILLRVPLCLLYFVSIGLAYVFGKNPSKEQIETARAERVARTQAAKAARDARRKAKSSGLAG